MNKKLRGMMPQQKITPPLPTGGTTSGAFTKPSAGARKMKRGRAKKGY